MLTQTLAIELGEYDVRILGVAPGLVQTPGVTESEAYRELDAQLAPTLPLDRTSNPDDIARVALFCASDLSKGMTGTTLVADAGQMAL